MNSNESLRRYIALNSILALEEIEKLKKENELLKKQIKEHGFRGHPPQCGWCEYESVHYDDELKTIIQCSACEIYICDACAWKFSSPAWVPKLKLCAGCARHFACDFCPISSRYSELTTLCGSCGRRKCQDCRNKEMDESDFLPHHCKICINIKK